MSLPVSIRPFLEPEVEPAQSDPWFTRLRRIPGLLPVAAIVAFVMLWDDAARKGAWPGLVSPFELSGQRIDVAAGWLVVAAGVLLAAGVRVGRRVRIPAAAAETATLPRLPVFLRFDGRRVLVVGGGPAAAGKIPALLDAGADVTVVAPQISPAIDRGRVRVFERPFAVDDLDGMWFVTAAAPPAINRQVRDAAETRSIFVNAVDDSANATAFLGGTLIRAGVTVAFSTAGRAPALAGLLRQGLDELIPDDIDRWAERAHQLSREQRANQVPMADRRPQLLDALNRLYDRRSTTPSRQ